MRLDGYRLLWSMENRADNVYHGKPFNPDADAIREYILDEAGEYKERLQ